DRVRVCDLPSLPPNNRDDLPGVIVEHEDTWLRRMVEYPLTDRAHRWEWRWQPRPLARDADGEVRRFLCVFDASVRVRHERQCVRDDSRPSTTRDDDPIRQPGPCLHTCCRLTLKRSPNGFFDLALGVQ